MLHSPRSLLLARSLLPLRRLPFNSLSSSAAAAAADAAPQSSLPFVPLLHPSAFSPDLNAVEIAASFKDWFRRGAAPLSPLDRIYAVLSSAPDGPSLESSLSRLDLRLSEDLVLRALHHCPHPSAAPQTTPDDLLLLRLKFFDWSGRQPDTPYRHTRSAYHAIFRLLSRARLASVVLDWLHLFSSSHSSPAAASPHSFLRTSAGLARQPRFHDTLVVGYAVAGRPELALQLFARMRFQGLDIDYFSYHVLFNSLVEADHFDLADAVLAQINARSLADAATACIRMKSLCRQARLAEAEAYLRELMSDSSPAAARPQDRHAVAEHAVGTLVHALCGKGRFGEAGRLVEEFGTSGAFGIWINRLVRARKLDTALDFLQSKKASEDHVVDNVPYNKLITQLLLKNRLEEVYDMLVRMIEEGIPPDNLTMNTALCFFCKAGMVDVAIQLYHSRMELGMSPTSWVYEHLISALCRGGSVDEACRVLEESMQQGFFPGKRTFDILFRKLCREGKLDKMRNLLDGAVQRKMKPSTGVFARYFSALCKAGLVQEACLVPHMVPGENTRLGQYKYIYTSLIHAFVMMERADMLPRLIIEMQEHGHSPSRNLYRKVLCCLDERNMLDLLNKQLELKYLDPRTCYNFFVEGAAHSKKPDMAREVYNRMVTAGIEPNVDTDTLMLQGYLKSRRIGDALSFFRFLLEKREPSTKLYNVFICGLCEAKNLEQAVDIWREARDKELIPSLECYEELVLALCSTGDYDTVVKVLKDFTKTGRPVSSFLCNVLLMHSLKDLKLRVAWAYSANETDSAGAGGSNDAMRSGLMLGDLIADFSHRRRVSENLDNLDEMIETYYPVDTFTYNILLRTMSMTGKMDSACNLFHRMRRKGHEPNRFSFDIIVHGFCKLGRRKDAETWIEEMDRHGFCPTYCTMTLYNNTS